MATETTIDIEADRRRARAEHQALLRRIIAVYDSPVIRAYCTIRFLIINIDILQIIGLGMRDKRRVLEIGCGFGLFGLMRRRRGWIGGFGFVWAGSLVVRGRKPDGPRPTVEP